MRRRIDAPIDFPDRRETEDRRGPSIDERLETVRTTAADIRADSGAVLDLVRSMNGNKDHDAD